MKRILIYLTVCAMLISTLALGASALAVPPAGESTTPPVPELAVKTTAPQMDKLLTVGLSTSVNCSVLGALSVDWKTADDITPENQKDIANHLKYGFSVAGISKLQRAVSGAIDGYWTTGNYGGKNSAGASKYGAFSYYMNEYLYNKDGDAALNPEAEGAEYETAPEGYIYQMLLTFNFGVIAKLDSFGWHILNSTMKNYPQAADIYVSNNGTDWTLVGYYDRVARLMKSSENDYVTGLSASVLGPDATGTVDNGDGDKVILFNLPEGTQGQFLRIACTAGNSRNDNYGEGSVYGSGLRAWNDTAVTSFQTWREMYVFGEKTSEVGYEYVEESETEGNSDATTTPEEESETIKVKEKTQATTEATAPNPSGSASEEPSATETNEAASKKGCASSVASCGVVALFTACGALLTRKKKAR